MQPAPGRAAFRKAHAGLTGRWRETKFGQRVGNINRQDKVVAVLDLFSESRPLWPPDELMQELGYQTWRAVLRPRRIAVRVGVKRARSAPSFRRRLVLDVLLEDRQRGAAARHDVDRDQNTGLR